jgi:hypothetical protein
MTVSGRSVAHHRGYCAAMRVAPDARTEPSEAGTGADDVTWYRRNRADLVWAASVSALVAVAFVVPHLHLSWLTPLITQDRVQNHALASTAPILGVWLPHDNYATLGAMAVAVAVVVFGPTVARRLTWRSLLFVTWMTASAWTVMLTLIDGPVRGWVGRTNGTAGYLAEIPRTGSVSSFLHGFASHIPEHSAAPWDISVAGDPPGALLTFIGLDRIGLHGAWWASALCVGVGTSAAVAVLVAIRALGDEPTARRAAPFVALAPLAVWVGVSSDGYFAGVAAWGVAFLALAASRTTRAPDAVAVGAGLLLGWSVYLDYGLILLAIPAIAVVVVTGNARPLIGAVAAALVVTAYFTVQGYWWLGGLNVLKYRYYTGIAHDRPYAYWLWANLVSLTCAVGIPAAVALRRALDREALRRRSGLHVLLVAFLAAVVAADVSGLSKAEVERIWLPFAVWLVAAPALLPIRSHRFCLVVQATGALVVNSLLLTNW